MTARLPSSPIVRGRRATSGRPGTPALRAQKLSRLVSTMKCLISRLTAVGETNRPRNHTHSRSMVAWAENRTGQARLAATMTVTATRDRIRTQG
jgi:hypothetical protein